MVEGMVEGTDEEKEESKELQRVVSSEHCPVVGGWDLAKVPPRRQRAGHTTSRVVENLILRA